MKRTIVLIISALLLVLAMPSQAQIISAIQKSVTRFAHGIVNYKDGHQEEYLWVEIPKIDLKELKVSNDEKHRKPDVLDAADIESVTIWTDKQPDEKVTLTYIHADKCQFPFMKTYPVHAWGYPLYASAWGVIYKCPAFCEENKKTGHLEERYLTKTENNGMFSRTVEVPAGCYMVCRDFENPQVIGYSYIGGTGFSFCAASKYIAPFFASNPAIKEGILQNKLNGLQIQYILDEMAAYHGLSPQGGQEAEEPNANGVAGDDE